VLTPIILFAYNRPEHCRRTLTALQGNRLADKSILHVYCDGPKEGAGKEDMAKIEAVSRVVKHKNWCKEVVVVQRPVNMGLVESIVPGVTEVLQEHGRAIVLEDDVITSPGFLSFMNEALEMYEDYPEVMHISGYMFPVRVRLPSTFFYNTASCWGWATWKRAWEHLIMDTETLIRRIEERNAWELFDIGGHAGFSQQLKANDQKRINTWAVRWYASMFLRNGLALHPYPSLAQNIGHDASGDNCSFSTAFNVPEMADSIKLETIELKESTLARKAMTDFYRRMQHPGVTGRILDRVRTFLGSGTA
jgi:hypothetical protein